MAGTGCWQYCAKLATPPDGEIAITIAVFPAVGVFGHPVRFRAFEKSGRPSLPGAPPFFAFGWLGLVKLLPPRDMQCPLRTRRSARIMLRTLRDSDSPPGPTHGPPTGGAERVLVNSSLIRC